jgi:hypothetical protein
LTSTTRDEVGACAHPGEARDCAVASGDIKHAASANEPRRTLGARFLPL